MPIQRQDQCDSIAPYQRRGYRVTGRAAHGRVARLFRSLHEEAANEDEQTHWIDIGPYADAATPNRNADGKDNAELDVSFLWENAPRYETKSIRDSVQVYSHLPNGINVLDDKWALARLMPNNCDNIEHDALVTLESHCFRGSEGFVAFANRVGLLSTNSNEGTNDTNSDASYQFEDLILQNSQQRLIPPPSPKNLWVIKDAMSNGAGGIWIVDPFNAHNFIGDNNQQQQSILHPQHRYIAQQYAWPPTLYQSRKCHVRVYGLITSDGRGYVHKRAFLHVANEKFDYPSGRFEAAVHITNCCANSHDEDKFSGEICVRLDQSGPFSTNESSDGGDLPLGDYFPSIAASVAALAERSAPFVQGGQANNGFEYLGLDFVLSSVQDEGDGQVTPRRRPVAYLLEVNAPPSQDTATGLPHAEALHDEVISDLLRLWVLPKLDIMQSTLENGWKCVYSPSPSLDEEDSVIVEKTSSNLIAPSKASILNKIRWAMFEKRASKEYELSWQQDQDGHCSNISASRISEDTKNRKCESDKEEDSMFDADSFVSFARSQFPYFSESTITSISPSAEAVLGRNIFLESGGGAQVPRVVINAMSTSLMNRDRSVVGAECLSEARKSILSLLAGSHRLEEGDEDQAVIMGANATSLIAALAGMYCDNGILTKDDEVVIASENHLANTSPWIKAANSVGAKIKWWTVTKCQQHSSNESMISSSSVLSDLINERTRIVAVSHASNILGRVRDISSICDLVQQVTGNQGHVIVDGVAAAPHLQSCGDGTEPDWYIVSLHKMFGPHLACLLGKRKTALQVAKVEECLSNERLCKEFEMGTMNYEACAGAIALNKYFRDLGVEVSRRYGNIGIDHQLHKPQISPTQASGDQVIEEQSRPLSNSTCLSLVRTCIHRVEARLLHSILGYLRENAHVRIIEDTGEMKVTYDANCLLDPGKEQRIPIVSFVHETLPSSDIVMHCRNHGVVCRACKFLSTDVLWNEMNLTKYDGVVRFSLAHYNTISDIQRTINILELLEGW